MNIGLTHNAVAIQRSSQPLSVGLREYTSNPCI